MYQPKTDGNVVVNWNINHTGGPQRYVSIFSVLTDDSTTGHGLDIAFSKKYVTF